MGDFKIELKHVPQRNKKECWWAARKMLMDHRGKAYEGTEQQEGLNNEDFQSIRDKYGMKMLLLDRQADDQRLSRRCGSRHGAGTFGPSPT